MPKKLVIFQLVAFLVFSTLWGISAADSHEITINWELPTYTVSNGDCATQGYPLPPDKIIEVTVRYRVQGEDTWQEAEAGAGATSYTITGLPPESAYEISVGPHYPGSPVLCFSSSVMAATPGYEPPQGCTSLTVTNVQ